MLQKKHSILFLASFLLIALMFTGLDSINDSNQSPYLETKIKSTSSPKASANAKEGRDEYFKKLLNDPATGEIPAGIFDRELEYAQTLPQAGKNSLLKTNTIQYDWEEVGPNDVGGRTRALAIDITNSSTILAGGISGGIWKSTDNGQTWTMKTTPNQRKNISAIAQDTRSGHTNTWYATTGEFDGNSASESGAPFRGAGIYKSTDNGESWSFISSTEVDPTSWTSQFNYAFNIKVSPTTGTVFLASAGFGVFRSTNGGSTFTHVLGSGNPAYSDVDVEANGTVVASISSSNVGNPSTQAGVWKSTNDGVNWSSITPSGFPSNHERSVVAIAPSNNNTAYVMTVSDGSNNKLHMFEINVSNGSSTDRTSNVRGAESQNMGGIGQVNYNLVMDVKPDDPDFVMVGWTNLYRTFDGFSTSLDNPTQDWIGGYGKVVQLHNNHHPDNHSIAFDRNNPNHVWSGHDGGLSYTDNITNTSFSTEFPWTNKNNGYNVTQFYTVALYEKDGDPRMMGGTQDNGTPYFVNSTGTPTESKDVSSGDGSFCAFIVENSKVKLLTSSQYGFVMRVGYNTNGTPRNAFTSGGGEDGTWALIHPANNQGSSGQLFISPFIVDRNNNNIMYYADGGKLWRTTQLSSIPDYAQTAPTSQWTELTNLEVSGYITTLAVSDNPANKLYLGMYTGGAPQVRVLSNANTATSGANTFTVNGATSGSWISDIAINPNDADEILVTMSNYNIDGIWYSSNGAGSFTNVEGNLSGTGGNGPSIRSAAIVEIDGQKLYLVGTSTGLYSTTTLNGSSTVWVQESPNGIGNTVVPYLYHRKIDDVIAVGTHGRGMFRGTASIVGVDDELASIPEEYSLEQNYPNPFNPTTTIKYSVTEPGNVKLSVFDIKGELISTLVNETKTAGNYSVVWNGKNSAGAKVASGTYIYRIETNNFIESKKMTLVK